MTEIARTLPGLRDVSGVLGSFVVDREGALVASDLPALFGAELLDGVAGKLLRLEETLGTAGPLEGCVLRFAEHKLHVRPTKHALLAVLSEAAVNAPTLKMALTLVARKVDGELAHSTGAHAAAGTTATGPLTLRSPLPPQVMPNEVMHPSLMAPAPPSFAPMFPPPSSSESTTGMLRVGQSAVTPLPSALPSTLPEPPGSGALGGAAVSVPRSAPQAPAKRPVIYRGRRID
jgi:predicted regulator of Ras-like GTPase activity (Roadblock/LC7/MglB family)